MQDSALNVPKKFLKAGLMLAVFCRRVPPDDPVVEQSDGSGPSSPQNLGCLLQPLQPALATFNPAATWEAPVYFAIAS